MRSMRDAIADLAADTGLTMAEATESYLAGCPAWVRRDHAAKPAETRNSVRSPSARRRGHHRGRK